MCRKASIIGLVTIAFTCSILLSNAAGAEFIPLGFLPGNDGSFVSRANAVNDDGSTVAGRATAPFGGQLNDFAVAWTEATGMFLIPEATGAFTANSISANGSAIVGRAVTAAAPNGQSFLWTSMNGFEVLPDDSPGFSWSDASDISGDGNVVVGTRSNAMHSAQAFRWTTSEGFIDLGNLPGRSAASGAMAISTDGSVIVGHSDSVDGTEAFRWSATTGMISLGDLPGGLTLGAAFNTSTDGTVVVGVGASDVATEEAFRWDAATGMIGLGFLPGLTQRSLAFALNGDGSVIVGTAGLGNDELTAFVWNEQLGIRSLQSVLITEFGLANELMGWQLAWASDISPDGLNIVGWGYNPQGIQEGWLVRLDHPLNTPEPSALLLGAAALVVAAGRRKPRS